MAKNKALEVLESVKIPVESSRDVLLHVARTSLRTKVAQQVADILTDVCVDAVLTIKEEGKKHFTRCLGEALDMFEGWAQKKFQWCAHISGILGTIRATLYSHKLIF